MDNNSPNNKRIAKNTLLLFFRMILLTGIGLYTSRVILKSLGVDDYGIYNVVGGIVGFLSFLNGALSNGSSRFITYEMGKQGQKDVRLVFQTTFAAHLILALIIGILAETIGLWFLYNKLQIPPERLSAAVFAFHCSIVTAVVNITQVPYNSVLIAHEKMDVYAYFSILDVCINLAIAYLIQISPYDRLYAYALLLMITGVFVLLLYRMYCKKRFEEASLNNFRFSTPLVKEILSFSSWSLLGNAAHTLNGQGLTIITNMFFGPSVVAARALSITINTKVMGLVTNVRTAANPQIVKLYAANNVDASKRLMLNTSKYAFLLITAISVPIIICCDDIMNLWLVEVPEYTVIFSQLILIQSMFFTLDACFYSGLYACGKVKENAMISPSIYFVQFVIVGLLFMNGFTPVSLSIVAVITSCVASCIAKPILLVKLASYTYQEIYLVVFICLVSSGISVGLSYLFTIWVVGHDLFDILTRIFISGSVTLLVVWTLGLNREERLNIRNTIVSKIKYLK